MTHAPSSITDTLLVLVLLVMFMLVFVLVLVLLFVLMLVLVGDSPPTAAVAVAAVTCCSDATDYSTIYNWLADRFEESEPTGAETTSLAPKGELSEKALQHTMYCQPIVNVYVLSCESTLIGVVRTCTYVAVYVRAVWRNSWLVPTTQSWPWYTTSLRYVFHIVVTTYILQKNSSSNTCLVLCWIYRYRATKVL